jgi:hypothetical protein
MMKVLHWSFWRNFLHIPLPPLPSLRPDTGMNAARVKMLVLLVYRIVKTKINHIHMPA